MNKDKELIRKIKNLKDVLKDKNKVEEYAPEPCFRPPTPDGTYKVEVELNKFNIEYLRFNWKSYPAFGYYLADLYTANIYVCKDGNILTHDNHNKYSTADNETIFLSFAEAVYAYFKNRHIYRAQYNKKLSEDMPYCKDYYKNHAQLKSNEHEIALTEELFSRGITHKSVEKNFKARLGGEYTLDLLYDLKGNEAYSSLSELINKGICYRQKSEWTRLAPLLYDLGRQAVFAEIKAMGLDDEIVNKLKSKHKPESFRIMFERGRELNELVQHELSRGKSPKAAAGEAYWNFWENNPDLLKENKFKSDRNKTLKNWLEFYKDHPELEEHI